LLTTWLRGSGSEPVIAARSAEGVTGLANPPRAPPPEVPFAMIASL
jgi:hypothetical protein